MWPHKNSSLWLSSPACRMFTHPAAPHSKHRPNSQNNDAETAFETFNYSTGSHRPSGTLTLSPEELPFTFPRQLLSRSG